MNSGRLRGGADAYRAAFGDRERTHQLADAKRSGDFSESPLITIALVGQVSSGKSSLINRLTGDVQAAVDVLPETREIQRFQYALGEPPVEMTLLDTPGYGESGASKEQIRMIQRGTRDVGCKRCWWMDAHSPAREAGPANARPIAEGLRLPTETQAAAGDRRAHACRPVVASAGVVASICLASSSGSQRIEPA